MNVPELDKEWVRSVHRSTLEKNIVAVIKRFPPIIYQILSYPTNTVGNHPQITNWNQFAGAMITKKLTIMHRRNRNSWRFVSRVLAREIIIIKSLRLVWNLLKPRLQRTSSSKTPWRIRICRFYQTKRIDFIIILNLSSVLLFVKLVLRSVEKRQNICCDTHCCS